MSHIDLSAVQDNSEYDKYVNDLRSYMTPSRPANTKPDNFPKHSLARVAWLMARGVCTAYGAVVLGDDRWDGVEELDLSRYPAEMPSRVHLLDEGCGHVETYRAFKVAYLCCAVPSCGAEYTQRRGTRASARWRTTCSDACRKEWRRIRDRATYAAKAD